MAAKITIAGRKPNDGKPRKLSVAETGIAPKWVVFARGWLDIESGQHCHWCKHIVHDDGESHCSNPNSRYCDGDRIRTWDGETCAETCGCFELSDWYKADENFEAYMKS